MNEINHLQFVLARLEGKSAILNITHICKSTGVPRKVVEKLLKGQEPSTSYQNIMALYQFVVTNNI